MAEKNKFSFKFSDDELSLFKNTFCENVDLLHAVSNVFLQLPLNTSDNAIITSTFKGKKELLALMRKKLIAELDPNTPLGLNSDIWTQVNFENKLPELVILDIRAKGIVLKLLEEGLKRLADTSYKPLLKMESLVVFDDLSIPDDVYVSFKARNEFISHISIQMSSILGISGQSADTIEDIKKRLQTNSTK